MGAHLQDQPHRPPHWMAVASREMRDNKGKSNSVLLCHQSKPCNGNGASAALGQLPSCCLRADISQPCHLHAEPGCSLRVFLNIALAIHYTPVSTGTSMKPVCHPCPRAYEGGGTSRRGKRRATDSLYDSGQDI